MCSLFSKIYSLDEIIENCRRPGSSILPQWQTVCPIQVPILCQCIFLGYNSCIISLTIFYKDNESLGILQDVVESVNKHAASDGRQHSTSIETQAVLENTVIDNPSTPTSNSGSLLPDPLYPIYEVEHDVWENELSISQRQSFFRTHNILIRNRPAGKYTVCRDHVKELLGSLHHTRTIHGMLSII